MSIRDDLILLESALQESKIDSTLQKFLQSPMSELVSYSFDDAETPVQLQHAMIGMATELHTATKHGDYSVMHDYGITQPQQLQQFFQFARQVAQYPQQYFNSYKTMHGAITESDDLEQEWKDEIQKQQSRIPYLDGAAKQQAENDLIDAEGNLRQSKGL